MFLQFVSCIAVDKLFVGTGKKKLPIVTPPALCSSQENVFGKMHFFLNRKIISFVFRAGDSPVPKKSSARQKNTESIAGLRMFVVGLEKKE